MIFVHKCACCQPCWEGEWLLMCKIAGTGFNLHIPRWCDRDRSEQRDAVVIKIRVGSEVPCVAAVARTAVALGKDLSLPNGFGVPLPTTHPSPPENHIRTVRPSARGYPMHCPFK